MIGFVCCSYMKNQQFCIPFIFICSLQCKMYGDTYFCKVIIFYLLIVTNNFVPFNCSIIVTVHLFFITHAFNIKFGIIISYFSLTYTFQQYSHRAFWHVKTGWGLGVWLFIYKEKALADRRYLLINTHVIDLISLFGVFFNYLLIRHSRVLLFFVYINVNRFDNWQVH